MCGIVGGIAQRDITPILLEGLKRLEYRGYDSAGMAVVRTGELQRERAQGKVAELEAALTRRRLNGRLGIAHTRWATHGKPSRENAHPHLSSASVAVVHNGIIENFEPLKARLEGQGYRFHSETDTEVIAHLFDCHYRAQPQPRHAQEARDTLLAAFRATLAELHGAYALGIIHCEHPEQLLCARMGSPLVIGVGSGEHFIASDPLALLQVTDRFVYLEEGDHALLTAHTSDIFSSGPVLQGEQSGTIRGCGSSAPLSNSCYWQQAERPIARFEHGPQAASKGDYRHFMLKEIHEQPEVLVDTLADKLTPEGTLLTAVLGPEAAELLPRVKQVQIVACGTSYHAGLVARYWLESLAGLPCSVEVASEFRYRHVAVQPGTLFVTLSQSGETADTLAALRFAKSAGYLATLAICNVPGSSLVRESQLRLMTHAGPEIGVASTKAFTTQLAVLAWLALVLGREQGRLDEVELAEQIAALQALPEQLRQVLELEPAIAELANGFAEKRHTLFLGRGAHYPVAMEGALKLKEISYIHAEAYAAGELKHGPLALVDDAMPVVSVAPSDALLEKLKSNLQEVRARGGRLINFVCERAGLEDEEGMRNFPLPKVPELTAPILYSVPLQLLSYHVALVKGTDVDKPRNLAKSVTVE
ncbi:glutamine--fructose-6-phosphate transaminase (isomerizing) [Halomonas sp. ATCH28]|uniref:Glutamine--fructose-6-phosphate aminotransferase [isomerizing] n=1 Tax=Halomonas gemina TaxID=2945105 RepID=A0ABT0SZA2_9GAMM|nr:glutamine--fructose-6-phosphate transaminase (isomerizing) [Halomonas gemina]MCL7939455.1 glutamine--fructose-6-phosphate transaminase (isomerizing) [Halomonas gemina]